MKQLRMRATEDSMWDWVTLETKEDVLWWQAQGLSYTASGYGRKIPTRYKVKYNNRWYRVYCCIFSNSGTCYIVTKDKDITIYE